MVAALERTGRPLFGAIALATATEALLCHRLILLAASPDGYPIDRRTEGYPARGPIRAKTKVPCARHGQTRG